MPSLTALPLKSSRPPTKKKKNPFSRPSLPFSSRFDDDYYVDEYSEEAAPLLTNVPSGFDDYYDEEEVEFKAKTPNFRKSPFKRNKAPVAADRRSHFPVGYGGRFLVNKRGRSNADEVASSAKNDDDYYDDYYNGDYGNYNDDVRNRDGGGGYGHSGGGGGGGGGGLNPLALLVAPLAGIALLSAAAAVALNPVLINVSVTGKRKKRDLENDVVDQNGYFSPEMAEKLEEMQVLEEFLGQVPKNDSYQQKLLSMYLTCSGFADPHNLCLDRVVCEYSSPESDLNKQERSVISM